MKTVNVRCKAIRFVGADRDLGGRRLASQIRWNEDKGHMELVYTMEKPGTSDTYQMVMELDPEQTKALRAELLLAKAVPTDSNGDEN